MNKRAKPHMNYWKFPPEYEPNSDSASAPDKKE